jgi:hypothetical protein
MFQLLRANSGLLVKRLFYQKSGQVVVSAVFGLALALMFQRVCKGSKCIIVHAPPSEDLDKIHHEPGSSDDCYKYSPKYMSCDAADPVITA